MPATPTGVLLPRFSRAKVCRKQRQVSHLTSSAIPAVTGGARDDIVYVAPHGEGHSHLRVSLPALTGNIVSTSPSCLTVTSSNLFRVG